MEWPLLTHVGAALQTAGSVSGETAAGSVQSDIHHGTEA